MRKIEGIVLAAGLASRAGSNKLLFDICRKTVIERCIESMYDFCDKIIVVGGYRVDEIEPILKKYEKIDIVYNDNFRSGMLSSIRLGISKLDSESFFLTPADYAFIDKSTYRKLLNSKGEIVIPIYENKKGHPLFMKTKLAKEFLNENGDITLRDYISKREKTFIKVENEGILYDIDTMDDYYLLLEKFVKIYR